jgi:2-polyprenyl-3-methyl-5-hydroxy-6-metoxy-1,4-benzoquinol methylase
MENLEKIAKDYHLKSDMSDMFIEAICQEFEIKWVKQFVKPNHCVLDLGIGDGLFLEAFRTHENFTIIEGSSSLVEHAKEKIKNDASKVKIIKTYFENYEPLHRFDVIIASHVLEHVQDPTIVLRKVRTWLKPGGILIVIVPNRESLHRRLGLILRIQKKLDDLSERDQIVGHLRVYSMEMLTKELLATNFTIKQKQGFFVKVLSNQQLSNLSPKIIEGLCELSSDLPAELGANIGIVATND